MDSLLIEYFNFILILPLGSIIASSNFSIILGKGLCNFDQFEKYRKIISLIYAAIAIRIELSIFIAMSSLLRYQSRLLHPVYLNLTRRKYFENVSFQKLAE